MSNNISSFASTRAWASRASQAVLLSAFLPCAALAQSNTLGNDKSLKAGETLTSNNGEYRMTFEPSGQIVVHRLPKPAAPPAPGAGAPVPAAPAVHWHSEFQGPIHGEPSLVMQRDNNLVVYDLVGGTDRRPVWNSDTCEAGQVGLGSLVLQDNGELTIMSGPECVWNAMRKTLSMGGGRSRIAASVPK